jgi:hypothetical protein
MLIRSTGAVKIVTISLGRNLGDWAGQFEDKWMEKIGS